MKKPFFMLAFIVGLFTLTFGQDPPIEQPTPIEIEQSAPIEQPGSIDLKDLANDVIKVIAKDSTLITQIPGGGFDTTNSKSIFEWWMFIFSLVMPLGLWVINKFFPSTKKKELILKSTSIAIVVLLIIVLSKGATILVIGQAVLAFIMEVLAYDKILQPLGLDTPAPYKSANDTDVSTDIGY